ncbi:hypothetical protein Tco_0415929, partial [Tanacetum coccineum]
MTRRRSMSNIRHANMQWIEESNMRQAKRRRAKPLTKLQRRGKNGSKEVPSSLSKLPLRK